MALWVDSFLREGYKIRQIFGQKLDWLAKRKDKAKNQQVKRNNCILEIDVVPICQETSDFQSQFSISKLESFYIFLH